MEVEFLPVYQPRPQESKDPTLYANNVLRVMAQALGIPVTECEFVGSLPVIVVDQLKAALKPQLWELEKVLQKAGLSPGCVDMGAEPDQSRLPSSYSSLILRQWVVPSATSSRMPRVWLTSKM